MTPALLLAAGILTAPSDTPTIPTTLVPRAAYEAAREQAGTTADAQVRLALWCEAHGLAAERLKHLAMAALRDPGHATARGLMGIVRFRDGWVSADKVARQVSSDEKYTALITAYHHRRDQAPRTADGQANLARWCEENSLPDEARAHHAVVLQLDPDREVSRRKLGYKKDGRRWVTDEQLVAEKAEVKLQKEADRKWKAQLTEWRGWLDDRGERRGRAEAGLAELNDPRAVPSIVAVFGRGNDAGRARTVRLLGQVDSAGSSRALAALAVFDASAEIRRAATETLKHRDPREFAGHLVALLRDPIPFEVRHVGGPGSPGALFVGGKEYNVQRIYAPPAVSLGDFSNISGSRIDESGLLVLERTLGAGITEVDPMIVPRVGEAEALAMLRSYRTTMVPESIERLIPGITEVARRNEANETWRSQLETRIRSQVAGSPDRKVNVHIGVETVTQQQIHVGRMMLEAQQAAISAEQQLQSDIANLEATNREIRDANDRVGEVLSSISGKAFSANPTGWQSWWMNQIGYRSDLAQQSSSIPTIVENVPLALMPQWNSTVSVQVSSPRYVDFRAISCFGAGTLVRTLDGSRAIETLKVGDRVLTQSVANGSLGYHPITRVHHNPPSPTFLVKLDGDTIVSSPFHRFWVAGRGWVMARDLQGGETFRLLDGTKRVNAVEEGPVQPVFNLDVAGEHDFFAGGAAALVHDNTLPDVRLVPFDAPATLAGLSSKP